MNYGALSPVDVKVMELCLAHVTNQTMLAPHQQPRLKILEVGIHNGATGRGIKEYCDHHGIVLDYWCVENGAQCDPQPPFDGATLIKGDSAEVFHLVPDGFDLAFIDACHCINHVTLDTLNYGARVRVGGLMLFHDTAPDVQQTMRDPHGPDIPEFHNSINAAHGRMHWPFPEWGMFHRDHLPGHPFGGITAYKKWR